MRDPWRPRKLTSNPLCEMDRPKTMDPVPDGAAVPWPEASLTTTAAVSVVS
jgi:hypothetical protein